MYISLGASLKLYEWYVFKGKRAVEFNDHNRTHDLKIGQKDKFGLRKMRDHYKLIDLSDPDTIFKLSEQEVKKLLRRSEGYSGTYRGTKLVAGKTDTVNKKQSTRQPRPHAPRPDSPNKHDTSEVHQPTQTKSRLFPDPDFEMPPKKATIQRLYNYFNKLHFNNECPTHVTFQFTTNNKKLGEARIEGSTFKLRLSKRGMVNQERVRSILLHEMIHLLHFKRAYVDGNTAYIRAGHGPLFIQEMDRLNKLGYKINVRDDSTEHREMAQDRYAVLFKIKSSVRALNKVVVYYSDIPFDDFLPNITKQFVTVMPWDLYIEEISYGSTRSSLITNANALTQKLSISKNQMLRGFNADSKVFKDLYNTIEVSVHKKNLHIPSVHHGG